MVRQHATCPPAIATAALPWTLRASPRRAAGGLGLLLLAAGLTCAGPALGQTTIMATSAQDYVTAVSDANAGATVIVVNLNSSVGTISLGGVPTSALTMNNGSLQIGNIFSATPIADGTITNNTTLSFVPANFEYDTDTTNLAGTGGVTVTPQYYSLLTLAGTNTYSGGTTVIGNATAGGTAGAVELATTAALPNYGQAAANGSILLQSGGGLATGYALDQTTLNAINGKSVGYVALGVNSANALDFTNLPNVSLGAVSTAYYAPTPAVYSGALTPTPAGGASLSQTNAQYQVGGGNGILQISSNLGDAGGRTELDNINGGYTILSGTNTFTGGINVASGILTLATPAAYCGIATSGCANLQTALPIQISQAGVLASSYALDQPTLNAISGTSTGVVALAANSSNNLNFTNLPNVSLGAVGGNDSAGSTGFYTYSGTITPGANGYLLGGGGGGYLFDQGTQLTVSSVLTDLPGEPFVSETLTVNPNPNSFSTVVLINANTYTGLTTVDNGYLYLGNGTTNGTIADSSGVALTTGSLGFNEATPISFAQPISGTGDVGQFGPGTVTLTQSETYTGVTSIYGGTLALSSGASIASSGFVSITTSSYNSGPQALLDISQAGNQTVQNLASSGTCVCSTMSVNLGSNTLTVVSDDTTDHTGPTVFNGIIAGTGGSLVKQGADTLTLAAVNTYTGGTTISAGTLDLGGQGLGASAATVGTVGSGPVTDNANLAFTEPSALTFTNVISGTGTVIQSGPGTITLNGANTYTGLTTVAAGTLIVGDTANDGASVGGSVQVNAGTTLAGYGSLGVATSGTTLTNSGTVIPGAVSGTTIGTLSTAGNYVQGSGGNLVIAVTPTQASELQVGGNASLAGKITFNYAPGTYLPITYTVLSATGSISGRFGTVAELGSVPTSLTRTVEYVQSAPDPVLLVLSKGAAVVTPNDGSAYSEQLGSLTALADSSVNTLLNGGGSANDCFTASVPPTPTESGASAQASAGIAAIGRMVCDAGGWIHLDGTFLGVNSSSSTPSYHADTAGFLAGVDRPVGTSGLRLGIAAGYDQRWLNDSAGGNATAEVARFGLYAIQPVGPVVLNATLLYGHDWDSTNRPTGVGTATAQYGGNEISGGFRVSLPMTFSGFSVVPMGGVRFASVGSGSFAESASGPLAGFGVSGAGTTQLSVIPYTRVVVSSDFILASGMKLSPYATIGYQYQAADTQQPVLLTAADGTTFNIGSTSLNRSAGTVGVGMAAGQGNWSVFASYGALISGNWQQQEIDVGLRLFF